MLIGHQNFPDIMIQFDLLFEWIYCISKWHFDRRNRFESFGTGVYVCGQGSFGEFIVLDIIVHFFYSSIFLGIELLVSLLFSIK
jgi:hypothetical protein